jgi:hypothetical protein
MIGSRPIKRTATFAAGAVAVFAAAFGGRALAEPQCQSEIPHVQREVAQAPLSSSKGVQVQALLEQVVRACKENNDVVAMAGIDQVRAIISSEKKPEDGS